jgi:enoyl-[acyl-carrier protein] reductase I
MNFCYSIHMLEIDLKGKKAFIAGLADDQGYGWAIAKALEKAGATIIVGTWPPVLNIFKTNLERGKFAIDIAKIYPLDATFDTPEQVPDEIKNNKRYQGIAGFTIQEVAQAVKEEFGTIDILVHSLANGPEVQKPLLETSRNGYLAAHSASSYSFVSLLAHFGPLMPQGSATLSLSYIAAEKAIPGYGGGMSSAKAALESDTRMLAWEAGRKWGVRVNCFSCGPLASRAAKAIGFIETMITFSEEHAPLKKPLEANEVGNAAAFFLSPLASAITGVTLHVDNGMHAMGSGPF